MVKEYISAPKQTKTNIDGPRILVEKVPLETIKIDKSLLKKEADFEQVINIWTNFDEKLWHPILINAEYCLLDGQNRLQVAKLRGLRFIDVIIDSSKVDSCEDNSLVFTLAPAKKSKAVTSKKSQPPTELELEQTTVWDFPERGSWATHKSDYRGNFAPQIARNIILNYSEEGELILDPMMGSGTTLIEARLLTRNAIGFDINQKAVDITEERLKFEVENNSWQKVKIGDVRNLAEIADDSIDLILTHPPYANIVTYSDGKNPDDLSSISSIDKFLDQLEIGLRELFRVLKPGRYCAILIGDTRKAQHYVPLSHFVLDRCLRTGFALKEQIIKTQHNCKYSRRWTKEAGRFKFYLIMHEHLFVFRKPRPGEDLKRIRYSVAGK